MSTEKEKMIAGEMYDPMDPELVQARRKARDLVYQFNLTRDEEYPLRVSILKELIGSPGANIYIEPPFHCDYGANISTGANVFFNFNCIVLDVAPVVIGENTFFGPNVQIYTATHPLRYQERESGREFAKPVSIGRHAWIGGSVVICPGVTIGDYCVIGAGSVVTHDIPAGYLAAGNPCKIIRPIE